MKTTITSLLLFLFIHLAYGSHELKNDTTGRLIIALANESNGIIQTVSPFNGGSFNIDSLRYANKLQVLYHIDGMDKQVTGINYGWYVLPPGNDGFFIDTLTEFKLTATRFYRCARNAYIYIKVRYIIVEENDTVFNPTPEHIGELKYRWWNGDGTTYETQRETIEFWRKTFNHSLRDKSFYKKNEFNIEFMEKGIVFKLQ